MNWTQLLKSELEATYSAAGKLFDKVDPDGLGWKPETGANWMTVGQLLKHISQACGANCRGFATGDWGLPPGVKFEDLPPEQMLPSAESMPAVGSVVEAKQLLEADQALAVEMIEQAGESDLAHRKVSAPWNPGVELPLGQHFLRMIQHLDLHKAQLFYYLKLQGKPVNTADLWGAPPEAEMEDFDVLIRTGMLDPIAIGLAENLLKEAGIPYFAMDRNVAARQESGNFLGWWNVRVPHEREAEAREILASVEQTK